jgi:hypothetical protein
MRIAYFLFGISILFFNSCAPKTIPTEYILTDEQLSNLMLDMQLVEVAMGEVNGEARDSLKTALSEQLEEVYNQPITVLESEIRKLESYPVKLIQVMDRVQVLMDSLR